MKSIWIFLICVIILVMPVKAGIATGYVILKIINEPPKIENITLFPEVAFVDSILECDADVIDEFPEFVELQHEWYVNGKLVSREDKLKGFNVGDNVECKLTPKDIAQNGTPMSVFADIRQARLTTRLLKNTFNLLGSETYLGEINSYQEEGFVAITGFAVANVNQNKGTVSLFGILIILVIVNVNLVLRKRLAKKTKCPRQDYSSS